MKMAITEVTVQELDKKLWDDIDNFMKITGVQRGVSSSHYHCPFHEDKKPSMSVDSDKRLIHCFSCGRSYKSPIKFLQDKDEVSFKDAKTRIEAIYNVKIKASKEDYLNIVMTSFNDSIASDSKLIEYLKNRGIRNIDTVLNTYPIGSTSGINNINSYGIKLKKDLTNVLGTVGFNSLAFGYINVNSEDLNIEGIKFRNVLRETGSEKKIKFYPKGNSKGLFGPQRVKDSIVVAEGEIDALAIFDEFVEQGKLFDVYATGGRLGSSKELPAFYKSVSSIYYIPDSPNKKGDSVAIQYLKSLSKEYSGNIYIFDWEEVFNKVGEDIGEDPADLVKNGHGKLITDLSKYYITADDYLVKVNRRLKSIDVEAANKYTKDDIALKTLTKDIPLKYVRPFLDKIEKGYLLDSIVNITDEDLYLEEIISAFKSKFEPLFVSTSKNTPELFIKNLSDNTLLSIKLSDPPNISQITPYIGDLVSWMMTSVPTPSFILKNSTGDSEVSMLERDRRLKSIFNRAIGKLSQQLPKRNDYTVISDGIHYIDDTMVLINGNKSYYFDKEEHKWKELKETVFKQNIILGEEEWAPGLTVEQLNFPKPIKSVYKKVEKLIRKLIWLDESWKYKVIQAYVFYAIIHQASQQKTFLWLNAKRSSGKSTLLKLLSYSRESQYYKLIEPAVYFSDFTEPSLRRAVSHKTLPIFLDEFEETKYESVFPLLRQANDAGYIIRASKDNDRKVEKFKVSFCAVLGSISISPNPADVSRVIIIKMKPKSGEAPPPFEQAARSYADYDFYRELSRDILISSLNNFQEYLKIRRELNPDMFYGITEARALDNYLNIAAILEMVGDEFTEDELDSMVDAFLEENVSDDPPGYKMIEKYLFNIYEITLPEKGTKMKLSNMLADPHLVEYINNAAGPINVDLENGILILLYRFIDWSKIDKSYNAQKVKIDLTNSPRHISHRDLKKKYNLEPDNTEIYLDIKDLLPKVKRGI